jgi:GNAT superfamily N-acetyltransferase
MIAFTDSLAGVTKEHLQGGFFAGWPRPPSPATHYRLLANSDVVVLARTADGTVVGFVTAVSDQVSCAYIPHLEVLPEWQGQGIGSALLRRMMEKLRHLYMVDLVCDPLLQPFYEQFGMRPVLGMVVRNYDRQACEQVAQSG